jgi:hypothetical protein
VRLAQDDGIHEVARHRLPTLARERPADRASAFAKDKGIPLGVNVESVSIRAEEIEAAGELFEALSAGM